MKRITFIDRRKTNRILDFSEKLAAAATVELAWSVYAASVERLGGKSVAYGFFPKTIGRSLSSEIVSLSSHSEEFNRLYFEEGYIDHDPYAHYCMLEEHKTLPWGDPRADKFKTSRSSVVEHLMKGCGIEYGVTIPLRDAAGVKLGGTGIALDVSEASSSEALLKANLPLIENAAMLFHARVQESDLMRQVFSLSEREKECLLWVSAGLTNKEIAFKLSLSTKTVELHIRNAAQRLNARNRSHAVARALIYDVIDP